MMESKIPTVTEFGTNTSSPTLLSQPLSNDELVKICHSNNCTKLNLLSIPLIDNYIIPDSKIKLDEGSSGLILKTKLMSSKKTCVVKVLKSEVSLKKTPRSSTNDTANKNILTLSRSNSLHTPNRHRNNSLSSSYMQSFPMQKSNSAIHMREKSISNARHSLSTNGMEKLCISSKDISSQSNLSIQTCNTTGEASDDIVIRPLYAFDALNEYLILSKLKTKYSTPVYGLFRYSSRSRRNSSDSSDLDSYHSLHSNEENEVEEEEQPIGFDSDPLNVCMILDYYQHSDLLNLCTCIRKQKVSTSPTFKDGIFMQLVQGLKYLHGQGIVHRDIKPENIFIDNEGILKYGDFGYAIDVARIAHYPITNINFLNRGTTSFKSPEIVNNKLIHLLNKEDSENEINIQLLKSSDIWSLAMLYCQIKFLNKVWKIASDEDTDYKKFRDIYHIKKVNEMKTGYDMKRAFINHEFLNGFLKSIKDDAVFTIMKMMNPDPLLRWNISDVHRSDWIVSVRMLTEDNGSKLKNEANEMLKIFRMLGYQ